MKIVADENIPYVQEFFGRFGEVRTAPGRTLTAAQLHEADVLLVRSVTRVDEQLLAGSSVRFVGTCTIGIDHLDTEYLRKNHIVYASAPGCNAGGVVQYVLAALSRLDEGWTGRTVGVIGSGNVGGRLCKTLAALGVEYRAYDPFLVPQENSRLAPLAEVLHSDIVCLHTPYTTAGPHPTRHMIGRAQLDALRPGTILVNAGRGGAVANQALLQHLRSGADLRVVLDVWENEPGIDVALLERVALGSPHIAGYSFEGKLNGSAMIHAALADFLGLDREVAADQCRRLLRRLKGEPSTLTCGDLNAAIAATYDITADDARLREAVREAGPAGAAAAFDRLRKTYPERREFGHFRVKGTGPLQESLGNIGFLTDD